MDNQKKTAAFVPLILTFFLWGSIYVGARLLTDRMHPLTLAAVRSGIGVLTLLFMARKHLNIQIRREDRKYFLLIGCLGYFLTWDLVQVGIAMAGASMAALINAMTPVSVTILAAVILKEQITRVKVLCLVLALAGAAIITGGSASGAEIVGSAAVLASVITWGVASVYLRRLSSGYPPVLVTFYCMLIGFCFHIPVGIAAAVYAPPRLDVTAVFVLLYLGIIGSGLAQLTWTVSLSLLPASTCSLFYPLQAVFSALLGALLLQETLPYTFFIGLLFVSADVALSTREAGRAASLTE